MYSAHTAQGFDTILFPVLNYLGLPIVGVYLHFTIRFGIF